MTTPTAPSSWPLPPGATWAGVAGFITPQSKVDVVTTIQSEGKPTAKTLLEGITVLADALRSIRGRKNLVLFSPGIREPGESVRNGMLMNTSRFYDPMIEALNASNVTVYAANLMPSPMSDPVFHQTLERMTNETNGEYLRYAISFNPMLENIEKETAGYYLLTYRVRKPRNARGFQKVDVSISNPEFRVKSRPGYVYGERD